MFKKNGLARARASASYRVYSDLCNNGYFWTPVLNVEWEDVGQATSRGNQTAISEDKAHITKVWFHCVHAADYEKLAAMGQQCYVDHWHPTYELAYE